jgi:hypothetical protein
MWPKHTGHFVIFLSTQRHFQQVKLLQRTTCLGICKPFWDRVWTSCISERVRRFGGRYFLLLQGLRGRKQQTSITACFCLFLAWFSLHPWGWRRYVSPKHRALSELHDVTQPRRQYSSTPVRLRAQKEFSCRPSWDKNWGSSCCSRWTPAYE